MSTYLRSVVAVLAVGIVMGAGTVLAQAPDSPKIKTPRKVVANASATVHVKPDAARLVFSVTTTDMTGRSASEANVKKVKTLKEAFTALALKSEVDVQVLPISTGTMVAQEASPEGVRAVLGTKAQTLFTVTVHEKDLEKLALVVTKLAETAGHNGGAAVDRTDDPFGRNMALLQAMGKGNDAPKHVPGPSIEWLCVNSAAARRDAIKQAVSDARADAEAAVGDAKLTVVDIDIAAVERAAARPAPLASETALLRSLMGGAGGAGGTESILIPIRAEVRVTYSY